MFPQNTMNKTKVTICCSPELAKKLEQIAKESDRSVSKAGSILLESAIAQLTSNGTKKI